MELELVLLESVYHVEEGLGRVSESVQLQQTAVYGVASDEHYLGGKAAAPGGATRRLWLAEHVVQKNQSRPAVLQKLHLVFHLKRRMNHLVSTIYNCLIRLFHLLIYFHKSEVRVRRIEEDFDFVYGVGKNPSFFFRFS